MVGQLKFDAEMETAEKRSPEVEKKSVAPDTGMSSAAVPEVEKKVTTEVDDKPPSFS